MGEFIRDNSLIIIAVGSFIILVALGFIIDVFVLKKKKAKKENLENKQEDVLETTPEVIPETNIEPNTILENEPTLENVQEVPEQAPEVIDENVVSNDVIEEVNESPFSKAEEPKNDKSPWEV